ncbi:MAG: site-2 protease family protein, partial [Candidatus Aminicenantes bacterium]
MGLKCEPISFRIQDKKKSKKERLNVDFTMIALYGIGGILVVYFLLYIFTAQTILGFVLKKPGIKIVDRSDCPGYLRNLFEIKEKELLELGFNYLYCMLVDDLYVKKYSRKYTLVYYHPQEKTYAELSTSDAADHVIPVQVSFSTHFTNGNRLISLNGLKHGVLGTIPNAILIDPYAETLKKQFDFHLHHLAAAGDKEGEIKEWQPDKLLNPDEITRGESLRFENYLKQLEKEGYIYHAGDNNYLIRTIPSLRFAHQMISGLKKITRLRGKITRLRGRAKQTDLPVELEVTNYLNTRAVFNQQIRNSSGKLFFLLLSVLLFGAAFSLILSVEWVLLLIAVVFLHEGGHLLAMRIFGYKNLRMLFIPLFGAVAMGTDKDVAPYKKVITYFAGPVPGILLAFLLLATQLNAGVALQSSATLMTVIAVLLILNYFNLIPIMPFDGGQVFNTVIFSRFPTLQLVFNIISFTAVLLLAFILQSPLLFFVALVIFLGLRQFFTQRRI